jgi:hypothetical protein
MIEYKDSGGVDCVIVTNEDGSTWSGLKSAYDAQQTRPTMEGNN